VNHQVSPVIPKFPEEQPVFFVPFTGPYLSGGIAPGGMTALEFLYKLPL
jgi:hypothetical protein